MAKESPFYTMSGREKNIINAPKERYGFLRELMWRRFSEAALRGQELIVQGYVDLLIQRLGEESRLGKVVDMVAGYNVCLSGSAPSLPAFT
jgi:hypothetical protein